MNQLYIPESHIMARFKREMTRFPMRFNKRLPVAKEYKFDGQGAYAPGSGPIPMRAVIGTVAFFAWAAVIVFVGAAVFY